MRIGIMAMVANMVCNLIFIYPLGYVGLALATACSGTLNAVLLFRGSISRMSIALPATPGCSASSCWRQRS